MDELKRLIRRYKNNIVIANSLQRNIRTEIEAAYWTGYILAYSVVVDDLEWLLKEIEDETSETNMALD